MSIQEARNGNEETTEFEPSQEDMQNFVSILVDNDPPLSVFKPVNELQQIPIEDRLDPQDTPQGVKMDDGSFAAAFYMSEHRYLGNTLRLPDHDTADPNDFSAANNPLVLQNGLAVTYGDINGFAGDYFGLATPICMGTQLNDRKDAFKRSFETLAVGDAGKKKAEAIQAALADLQAKIDEAISTDPEKVHQVYQQNVLDINKMNGITEQFQAGASFNLLAKRNLDHFGKEARIAYNAGHALALDVAASGDLKTAYAINAFADHFLQDSFAAGHVRVPRKELFSMDTATFSEATLKAVAANIMHEEDGELGLKVTNPAGESWHVYGDTRLFDSNDEENLKRCRAAQSASVKEVHDAFTARKSNLDESQFSAWQHAPTLENLADWKAAGNHAPLLHAENGKVYKRDGNAKSTQMKVLPMDSKMDYLLLVLENWSRVEGPFKVMLKSWIKPYKFAASFVLPADLMKLLD
ncbi:Nn.00g039940.m01.CDS01 [Neocucurbitaria sp. VM-36]